MGIKDINNLIKGCRAVKPLSYFSNKTCTVDTSGFLYQFLRSPYYQRLHERPILYGFLRQLQVFREYNIQPIYVFDGKPTKEKTETILERKKQKDKTMQELSLLKSQVRQFSTLVDIVENDNNKSEEDEEVEVDVEVVNVKTLSENIDFIEFEDETVEDMTLKMMDNKDEIMFELHEKIRKKEIQSFYPTKEDIDLSKELFDMFGVKYVQSSGEADPILNVMIAKGEANFAISKDMDILTYNTPLVVHSLALDKKQVEIYELDEVLEELNFDFDQFVDLCIMCGCDYVKRIPNIGPKRAYGFLKKHKTIENVLDNLSEKFAANVPEDYLFNVEGARNIFKNPEDTEYEVSHSDEKPVDEISEFLKSHQLPLDIISVEESPAKSPKNNLPENQMKITDFF